MAGPRHNRRIDTLETNNLEGMRSVTIRRCTRLPSTRLRRADALIASCGSKPAASTLQPPVATANRLFALWGVGVVLAWGRGLPDD